jgi:hypothetical protein
MAKLIIYVTGRPLIHGYKQGPFIWSETLRTYVYQGKEFSEQEFNAIAEKTIKDYDHLHPAVKVSEFSVTSPPIAPSAATVNGREITVDQAEAVMLRLAPERLKKKSGPKPLFAGA